MSKKSEFLRLRLYFVTLDAVLKQPQYLNCCRRTLADWASANDHAVPYALINRTVQDILTMGFDDVASIPGIGIKKLYGLIRILERIRLSN